MKVANKILIVLSTKNKLCDVIEVLANVMEVILQYINVSNQHIIYSKLAQLYINYIQKNLKIKITTALSPQKE